MNGTTKFELQVGNWDFVGEKTVDARDAVSVVVNTVNLLIYYKTSKVTCAKYDIVQV